MHKNITSALHHLKRKVWSHHRAHATSAPSPRPFLLTIVTSWPPFKNSVAQTSRLKSFQAVLFVTNCIQQLFLTQGESHFVWY